MPAFFLAHAWVWWLAAPALGVLLVSLGVWWRARPARRRTTRQSMAGHDAYLTALTRPPRERSTQRLL